MRTGRRYCEHSTIRKAPEVFSKYKVSTEKNHLSNRNKEKPKLEYKYYCCDYCHKEIKIEKKWEHRDGRNFRNSTFNVAKR